MSCMWKWYTRSIRPGIRARVSGNEVLSVGFKHGRSCDDIVAVLRQTIFLAFRWGCSLLLGALDVAIAFDKIDHAVLAKSLQARGLHPQQVAVLLRELTGIEASLSILGADSSDPFPLEVGEKQGGAETPDEFNILVETALQPLVSSWSHRNFG